MSINVNDKNLGHATAYAYYKAGGGTMTEAEFTEFMADFGTASQTAVEAAQAALASKNAAQTAATTATNKASEATTAAQTATTKAGEASTSASTAASAKDTAVSASQTATSKATEATTAAATATSAKTDAVAANTAAQSAKTAAQTAQTGAETAAASVEASAAQIATNAEDISQLKSELTAKADVSELLKAFPTDSATGAVASFSDGAELPIKSLVVDIEPVQDGTGDPSPDNVRPISGWTGATVVRDGKNLLALPVAKFNEAEATKANCFFVKAGTYILQYSCDAEHRYGIRLLDMAGNIISDDAHKPNSSAPYNSSAQAYYAGINVPSGFKTVVCNIVEDCYVRIVSNQTGGGFTNVQFEEGSTATSYEPYNGQTINIDWATEAGTVYGGTLDVLSGELVIDRAMVDLGSLNWQYSSAGTSHERFTYADSKLLKGSVCLCDRLQTVTYSDMYNHIIDNSIAVHPNAQQVEAYVSAYTDVNSFRSAMTGSQFCYELATPTTVTLTPNELSTLLGANNIWSDAGEVTAEYRADPTLFIQRLTEPDADMIADANIVSGQYFMVGNTLYKATANIASGATISPNVNCTRKSLSEALNELNA